MHNLLKWIGKNKEIQDVLSDMDGNRVLFSGLSSSQKACLIATFRHQLSKNFFLFCSDNIQASKIYDDLSAFSSEKIYFLPELDSISDVPQNFLMVFCSAVDKLLAGKKIVLVSSIKNLFLPLNSALSLGKKKLKLKAGTILQLNTLLEDLVEAGYEREDITESPGQFSVRGGIVDIFPYNFSLPLRLELFADEIDSLREYDPSTQRSLRNLGCLETVFLGPQSIFSHKKSAKNLIDFLASDDFLLIDQPEQCWQNAKKLEKKILSLEQKIIFLSFLEGKKKKEWQEVKLQFAPLAAFQQRVDFLVQQLQEWRKKNVVFLLASTVERGKRIKEILEAEGLGITNKVNNDLQIGQIIVAKGNIYEGFHFPAAQVVVVADQEIFGVRKKKSRHDFREKFEQGVKLTSLEDLIPGDYVVHINHGVGRYLGLETIESEGVKKDYLSLEYANKDKLYIPIEQMDMLQKYLGIEEKSPKLSKLGGNEWSRLKKKVSCSVQELAQELLRLYATREITKGYAFATDTIEQKNFEDDFPYEETEDQLRAVEEIKKDMESPYPMDRLLCGDVGYGKTEVAMRAVFKAVMEGKQVAILVPTTILAQQHFNTFQERFKEYAVNIAMISRFRTVKEQQEIIKNMAKGTVDIVIGTHRLVQKDINFKNLGLIIVDEEQRFGVAHKEKLKQIKKNVDVLTLTATPIPRTLYMSMVKIRNMSVIETPPEDRFPIQTYIIEYDENTVKQAIEQELDRNGQVFFLHNRVESIEKTAQRLAFLVPKARIAVAHGQMSEEELENTMWDFIQGHYDILVCTTIIETGLDVPNVNTLIVDDADKLGLSSLYQLRGRIGRSNRIAYAYLTYRQDKLLSEIAAKRLKAMRDFTALGSGFKIAMRDLEIRGAGSILGAEQHGHISSVGFELYAKMLQQAIEQNKGEQEILEEQIQPLIELKLNAYLPDTYIAEWKRKIEIYKKIASITEEEEVLDIQEELLDRFGDMPQQVLSLLEIAKIKILAKKTGVENITQDKQKVSINFVVGKIIKGDKLSFLINQYRGKIMIVGRKALQINVKSQDVDERELLNTIQGILIEISKSEEKESGENEKN